VASGDGVTVSHRSAEVRAFVPGPVDALPPELARLQVSALELDDPDRAGWEPPPAGWAGVVVAVTPFVEMSPGKEAAQSAHAAQLAWEGMDGDRRRAWADAGFGVRVVHPGGADWAAARAAAGAVVRDAGYTELEPGTLTTVAVWI
jgi:peptidyl-tRNA hydrolase